MAHTVDIRTGTTGPAHDPYGTELVTVNETSYYSDGLGCIKVWHGKQCLLETNDGSNIEVRRGAEAMFATHAGITLDAAHAEFERSYEPDPMGSASSYI